MVRKYFALALVYTLIVFSAGVLFGYSWDLIRKSYINEVISKEESDIDMFLLLYQIFEEKMLENKSLCEGIPHGIFYPMYKQLDDIRKSFETISNGRFIISQQKYREVAIEYLKLNIRAWILTEKYREACNNTNTALLLYNPSSIDGMAVRRVLEAVKQKYGTGFMLFHADTTLKSPLVNSIIFLYGIKHEPAVIINGKVVLYGENITLSNVEKYIIKNKELTKASSVYIYSWG